MQSIDSRLRKLEEILMPKHHPTIITVRDKDGNMETMNFSEFEKQRRNRGLEFVQIVRAFNLHDVDGILNSWDCIAQMDKDIEGVCDDRNIAGNGEKSINGRMQ